MGSTPIGISASRGAAILGLYKYQEPMDVWLKIMEQREPGFCAANGYDTPEFVDNAATRWGNALEDKICEFAEENTDPRIELVDRERLHINKDHRFVTCHIDARYKTPSMSVKILHEGKTVNPKTYRSEWGEPGTDHIPRDYTVQVNHQMACTGAEQVIVSVLVFPKMQDELPDPRELTIEQINAFADTLRMIGNFHQYTVARNDELIKKMLEAYDEFLHKNIRERIPPEPKSYDWIRKIIKSPVGSCVATEEIERLSVQYKTMGHEESHLKKQRKQIKKQLLNHMRLNADADIDDDATGRILMYGSNGQKLHSFNGKQFR